MHELTDAQEHLANLITQLEVAVDLDEAELRSQLGHIYSYLNRSWNGRNFPEQQHNDETAWDAWRRFPTDLEPL